MPTYEAEILCRVTARMTIEADSAEEAEEIAASDFEGLTAYMGNSGCDKLVGTEDKRVALDADCGWEILDVMEDY
ncbi:MAG: hypothetical protein DRQ46_08255 [Gammaproteobacteria bacterium]|nr:MAG: hypothetical protein DRQ46_08255 [Gammaproteobacteria bacterium]